MRLKTRHNAFFFTIEPGFVKCALHLPQNF